MKSRSKVPADVGIYKAMQLAEREREGLTCGPVARALNGDRAPRL